MMAQGALTSEELQAYEKLPVPFCLFLVHGSSCDIQTASDGFCELFEAPRSCFSSPSANILKQHIHPEDFANFRSDIESACFDPDGRYAALYRIRKGGSRDYRWISGKGHIERQEDGSYLLYVFFSDMQNETELRREAIAEHLRQDALLTDILSTTKTAIFWKDADRRFLGANRAFLDYYGFADERDIIGKNDEDMGWHTEPDPYKNDEIRVLHDGISTTRVPGTCIAKGENRHIVASKSPLTVDGEIVGLVGSFEDVTDEYNQQRKIAQLNAQLEKSLSEHHQLMSTSQVCIVKIDLTDFTFVEYNDAMCRMLGLTRDEYEARYHHDMKLFFTGTYESQLDSLKQAIEAALASGQNDLSINLNIPGADGELWVAGAGSFSDFDPETGRPHYLMAVYRNVTDIYEAQQKIAQTEIEAQRVSMMEEQFKRMRLMLDSVPSGLGAMRIVDGVPESTMQLNRYFTDRVDLPVIEGVCMDTHKFANCLHPDDRERCRKDFADFLKVRELSTAQYRFRNIEGSYYWGRVRGIIVRTDESVEMAYFIYSDISEMKAAEAKLRESRELYKRTVDALQIGMWMYDIPNRRIHMGDNAATDALRKKYNWPKTFENVPESQLELVEEDDRENYLAMFKKVAAGHDASCDVWYKQHLGAEPHCERESYHVVFDESGKPLRAYGVGINITAEKKVDERYQRELEYLRNNSDESLMAKGHYNLTRNVVLEYESRVGESIYTFEPGTSYDEAFEGFLELSYDEEDQDIIDDKLKRENLIRRYQKGQMQTTLQYRRAIKGQEPIWISMTVHTYMQPENGDLELFSYAYDVTMRKRIETVMELVSKSAFQYIGMIYAADSTFELIEKSPSVPYPPIGERVDYIAGSERIEESFSDPVQRKDFHDATELDRIISELRSHRYYTTTYYRTTGTKTLCSKLDFLWFDEQAQIILSICSNVTASFERDQQQIAKIEAAKLEAERANEAKSMFLSSMSHDLRTPLSGVLGFTGLALAEPDTDKKQEYLQKIDSSGKLLLDLINDTLELSRIESGKLTIDPEAVLPDDLVPAIVTALRPSAELKHIRLEAEFPTDEGAPIWCDRLKVQKIALNLISNAIKYTPDGGTVTVRQTPANPDERGTMWTLHVEDDGIGMSKEFMERMFEPFSQEQRSESVKTPGTGLGLSIVKRYVDLMGGTIEAESELHKGTKWTVSLPLATATGHVAQKAGSDAPELSLTGKRVLVCEDNYMNMEIAVMLLKEQGIVVETAENGSIGVEAFSESADGYYDAILMDFRMPVMDGLTAARTIRKLVRPDAKTIPIIAMTADAFEENIREAKDAGMSGYVTKPIEPQKLFETLRKCLSGAQTF